MARAISWKLDESTLGMIDELAALKNWSKATVIREAIKLLYDENIKKDDLEKGRIKIDNKYFKILSFTTVEIGEHGDMGIGIDKIIADEDIEYKEFKYAKGDLIYDNDSLEEKYSNINKTILQYQNYDDIPE